MTLYFVLVQILGSFLGEEANYLHDEVHKWKGFNICLPLEVARGVCCHRQDVVFKLSATQYTLCASEYYKTISASSHTSMDIKVQKLLQYQCREHGYHQSLHARLQMIVFKYFIFHLCK